jgi:hypothetical protein
VAQQTFPFKAYVTSEDVFVRSGPGENYYPTDKLKLGQEVEVYRQDPGGWYAIRPPRDSFSWVSSRYLQFVKGNLATVSDDQVAARVGSKFNDVRDVIQVRLHRGEVVEVLDSRQTAASNNSASNAWHKIAPPAGEFRWVYAKYVDPNDSRDGLQRHGNSARTGGQGSAGGATRRLSPEQFEKTLNDIDVEMSMIVIAEPNVWDFTELRERTQMLFDQAETAIERGRARLLLSKMARFEDIRQRHNQVAAMRQPPARGDQQGSQLSRVNLPSADPDGRFDARGQLTRIPEPKPGSPQYAILDESGRIRCYVSPAPGVNLRSYVGRDVGITGIRGRILELDAVHVMARHITVLDASSGGNMLR